MNGPQITNPLVIILGAIVAAILIRYGRNRPKE
jgi:hypothetical protein